MSYQKTKMIGKYRVSIIYIGDKTFLTIRDIGKRLVFESSNENFIKAYGKIVTVKDVKYLVRTYGRIN